MGFKEEKGITVASGFKLQANQLLDVRNRVKTIKERDELVTLNACPVGLLVYVSDENKLYVYRGNSVWKEVAQNDNFVHTDNNYTNADKQTVADAKAHIANKANPHNVTKAQIGLGNVDNTADKDKSVKYATTAGSAKASDVYAWAKQPNKPSYTKTEVGLSNVDNTADNQKSVKYATSAGIADIRIHQLTSEDLNTVKGDNKEYFAGGSNTCANKPSGIDAFGLKVYQTASGYWYQEIIGANTNTNYKYSRTFNGESWTAWQKIYNEAQKPTKADVGLGNVDNTADTNKNVNSARKLTTPRTIAGTSFDGSANIDINYNNLTNKPHIATYTIEEVATTSGYLKTYQLKKDSAYIGAKINIPKDMVVQSGTVKVVTQANVPYTGAVVGDKYIDLIISNASSSHIYIPVKDLVDVYTAGSHIAISDKNVVSAIVDDSLSSTSTHPVQNKVINSALGTKLNTTGNASNVTNTITEALTRENLTTGEKLSVSLGKIKKWFTDLKAVAFSGSYNDLINKPFIPSKTSDITNDSNFAVDKNYVHTDNNYTTAEKNKLSGIASGAEVNVQADWNISDSANDAFIKNKPTSMKANGGNADTVNGRGVNNASSGNVLWTAEKILSQIEQSKSIGYQYTGTVADNKVIDMTIPAITDFKTPNVEVLVFIDNVWQKAIHGIDYVYAFTSSTNLRVTFFNAGQYKVNYFFMATGSFPNIITSGVTPTTQNSGDYWFQKI